VNHPLYAITASEVLRKQRAVGPHAWVRGRQKAPITNGASSEEEYFYRSIASHRRPYLSGKLLERGSSGMALHAVTQD